jgi:hypothetical protein
MQPDMKYKYGESAFKINTILPLREYIPGFASAAHQSRPPSIIHKIKKPKDKPPALLNFEGYSHHKFYLKSNIIYMYIKTKSTTIC